MSTELAKAYVQIIPSAEGIKGKITEALGGEASSAGERSGDSFGQKMIGTIKTIIATAGIGKALSLSITEGGALQQSLGGIETLFKENADTVKAYAANAYKTAGLSANEYMQTVTSFSASLLQSMGQDTAAAAEKANMALTDMSDNANKMGTNMQDIQNAYQGFAKQNYTMLDNLKLGYGGTQEEMKRLLADAQAISGVEYDISSYADVVDAIHVIQTEMGITGTTAQEAATTYEGSLASMKAAAKNVLGNLSLGEDIGPSLTALSDTTYTFLVGNLLPMVGNVLKGLPQLLGAALSALAGNVPAILAEIGDQITGLFGPLTPVISGAAAALGVFAGALQFQSIIGTVGSAISGLKTAITGVFSVLSANPIGLVVGLVAGLVAALITLWNTNEDFRNAVAPVWEAIKNAFGTAVEGIKGFLSGLVDTAGRLWDNLTPLVTLLRDNLANAFSGLSEPVERIHDALSNTLLPALTTIGTKLGTWLAPTIQAFAAVLGGALATAVGAAIGVINGIISAISGFADAISGVVEIVSNAFDLIAGIFTGDGERCIQAVQGIGQGVLDVFGGLWNGVSGFLQGFVDGVVGFFQGLWDTLVGHSIVPDTIDGIIGCFGGLWDGVSGFVSSLVDNVTGAWEGIKDTVGMVSGKIQSTVSQKWNTINSATSSVFATVKSTFSSTWNGMKSTVSSAASSVYSTVSQRWSSVRSATSTAFTSVRSTLSTAWSGIKNTVASGASSVLSTVTSKFSSISSKISSVMSSAKNAVSTAISAIKSKFNFSWSLPKLKLPHVSISGKFSLTPPSVPKFSIKWYKDAMDNPLLLTSATIFGSSGGSLLGAGEAGPEVVSGADTLMRMMHATLEEGLSAKVDQVNDNFERLFAILGQYYPQFASGGVYLDGDKLVGQLAPGMDRALGRLAQQRGRGR